MRKFLKRSEMGPVILGTLAEFEEAKLKSDADMKTLIRDRLITNPLLSEYIIRNFFFEYINYLEKLLILK